MASVNVTMHVEVFDGAGNRVSSLAHTKTHVNGSDNPRHFASDVENAAADLTHQIASYLDNIEDDL